MSRQFVEVDDLEEVTFHYVLKPINQVDGIITGIVTVIPKVYLTRAQRLAARS